MSLFALKNSNAELVVRR